MKQLETDIVVIAAGTAGLPAAVTAAEHGARVIAFEKRGFTGGTGNRANMILGVQSRLQREKGINLTVEEAYKIHMEWTHWRVDARLVSAFYRKSGSTIDWLQDMGVEFADFRQMSSMPGAAPRPITTHVVKGIPPGPKQIGQAAAAMKILTRRAKELGVQFYLKTPVKKILKRGGRIVGVIAQDDTGQEIRVKAKAVIVATGGFSDNNEMMKEYTGYEQGKDMYSFKTLGVKGDGIRMAWAVGAGKSEMHMGLMHHLPPPAAGPGGTSSEFSAFQKPTNIMVNFLGERFVSEDLGGSHAVVGNSISIQPGRGAFMIFDGATEKYYEEHKEERFGGPGSQYVTFKHEDLDDNIREIQAKGYKYLYMADTLEDLCAQTGINLGGLLRTIDEYNQACALGRDDVFFKNPQYLRPFNKEQPKFYAGRFFCGAYNTVGGIKINYKTEVLTEDSQVIPGLYAAGADANAIYGHTYVSLAGNYMGFAINTGRIAGENAVEYIKSVSQ